ncbi:MAG: PAS domain S-box protein, partial [Deltaproteobacteria bacterium]|nr:PAS domain S-box protein [Deltaproteobacteria bacterium]
ADSGPKQGEENFSSLFYNMAQGAFYQNADGSLVEVNNAALEIFGLSRDQFLGKTSLSPDWKVILEDGSDLPGEEHPSMVALRTGKSVSNFIAGVYNARKHDYIWININAVPQFKAGEDKPFQVFVTLHDITDRKRAEEALRESEERFDIAVRGSDDGMWDWDIVTGKEYFSPRFLEILGYKEGELEEIYNPWESRIHPDDHDRVMSALKEHLEEGKPYSIDYRHRYRTGEFRWQNSRGQAVYDDNGKPVRMVGFIRDITDRKVVEEALRASEELHRLIITSMSDAVFITDKYGKFTYICPNVDVIFGYSYDEIEAMGNISGPLGKFYYDHDELSAVGELKNIEQKITDKAGTKHALLINIKNIVLKDESILYTCRDITKRKRAQEALLKSNEQLQLSIRGARVAIWDWSVNENFVVWSDNAEEVLGFTPGSFGNNYEDYMQWVHPEDVGPINERVSQALEEKQVEYKSEYRVIRPNGEIRWISAPGQVFYDSSGAPIRISGIMQDITDRKQAEEAL